MNWVTTFWTHSMSIEYDDVVLITYKLKIGPLLCWTGELPEFENKDIYQKPIIPHHHIYAYYHSQPYLSNSWGGGG